MRRFIAVLMATFALAGLMRPAAAQEFSFLGMTSLHSNDVLLDGDDRWQTGGASWSWMAGPRGTVDPPSAPFELWELRLRGQVITPDNFQAPAAWDRRAASVLTTTLHSHFETGGFELSAGAGVALTGPRTYLIDLQNLIHWLTPANEPQVPAAVQATQIPTAIYPTAIGEAAYRFQLGDTVTLRPFAEVQTGVETFVRAGFDVFVGTGFDGGVLARDGTTGFAYQTLEGTAPPGFSFTFGADAARVTSSALLPEPAYSLTPWRYRARAGLLYQGRRAQVFTGVSWLGREFSAQPTGQTVSALQLQWRF
jgi:Outer membrane protein LpxR